MVLMTLPVRVLKTSTLGGFFKIRSEGSWNSNCLLPAFHILPFTRRSQHRATGGKEWWWPCPQSLGRWHSQGPGWEQLAVGCVCSSGVCTVAF